MFIPSFLQTCEDILLERDVMFLRDAQMFILILDEATSGGQWLTGDALKMESN